MDGQQRNVNPAADNGGVNPLRSGRLSRRRLLALAAAAGVVSAGSGLLLPRPALAARRYAASGQVVVGLSQEPTVFNPLMAHIEVDEGVHYNLFDTLWGVDEKGSYFPILAQEVPSVQNGGISADGLTWRVKLRDGVKWHDGQPFSADDVEFTYRLIMRDDFKAGSRQGHDLIADFRVVSPAEVTWTMKEAYAPYLAILASTFIVPKHILGAVSDPNTADFNNAPVGTGAYVWGERVPGDHITLKANPSYFNGGPYIDTLIFKYIPDLTVMFTQFKTGEIDYTGIQGITADHYDEAKALADRVVNVGPSPFIENIWFNLGRDQFKEQAVREALYYAMDKDTIIKNIYYGLPGQAESYLPEQSWAFNPNLPRHEYDPQRAADILDQAGWKLGSDGVREKNGVKLAFTNSTTAGNKVREQAQAYLQQNWQDVGAKMEIKNMPAAVIWGDYFNLSQYDSVMVGLHYGKGPDPDATSYFHSKYIPAKGGAGNNTMQLQDSTIDDLCDKAARTVDGDARRAYYQQLQQRLRDQLVFLPIFQYATIEGTKAGLNGYVANANVVSNCWNINQWRWQ